ncbi:MAG: hypothetical protein HQK77_00315 [Desulfobacterales bacterium]|nr:hypothetical protein [Desulfobacterales bacterium]
MNFKKIIPTLLKLVFIVALLVLIIVHKTNKPRLFVLHSYHTDYSWVIQMNEGIRRALVKHPDIIIRHHYMDLKNHTDASFKRMAETIAHRTIATWQPNVIIIADDIAQKLVGSKYVNHPTISVVFCAVNGGVDAYGYTGAKNVTGMYERKPLNALRETAKMIAEARGFNFNDPNAKKPKVVFVCDTSESVTKELPGMQSFNWSPFEFMTPIRADNFSQWQQCIKDVNQYADIILVSDYREFRLPSGEKEVIKPSAIMNWTEKNSKIPILGMSLINVEDGGMLSVYTSGYEQGEVSGSMAVSIIKGKKGSDIPHESTEQFLVSVRESTMEQRNLPIPAIYEAFARAMNTYYE